MSFGIRPHTVVFMQGVILNVLPWIFGHISTISIFCFILLNFPSYLVVIVW